MNKIPTLFLRNVDDMRYVTREVHPDCLWVLAGLGVATRKYDGTCVMYDGERWWARREVKPGKAAPDGYVPLGTDDATGKTVGWEPIEQSSFLKYLIEATEEFDTPDDPDDQFEVDDPWEPGTFELVGPRINGNPEGCERHTLIRHTQAEPLVGVPRTYDGLAAYLADFPHEGIVWHHPDGQMAKLKRRDFPKVGA